MTSNYLYTNAKVYSLAFKNKLLCNCSHVMNDHGDVYGYSVACNYCKCEKYILISNLKFIELINDVTKLYTSK